MIDYEIADELKDLALKVMRENNLSYIDIDKIQFMKLSKDLLKPTCQIVGRCILMHPRIQKLLDKTYIIEFTPIFFSKSLEIQEMFMLHELLHISADMEGLAPHEYEEFRLILDKYGDTYYKELKILQKDIEIEQEKQKIDKLKQKTLDKEIEE